MPDLPEERGHGLLLSIARCHHFKTAQNNESHPCHEIVKYSNLSDFKPPEPWFGLLRTAKVMAISTNPSMGRKGDRKHLKNADDKTLIGFYENELDKHPQCPHWNRVRDNLTNNLWNDFNFSRDCLIVDIVHCRSNQSRYVDRAKQCCKDHLDQIILNAHEVTHLALFGDDAQRFFLDNYEIDKNSFTMKRNGKEYTLLPFYHPSYQRRWGGTGTPINWPGER